MIWDIQWSSMDIHGILMYFTIQAISEFCGLWLDGFDQTTLPTDIIHVLCILAETSGYVPSQTPLAETAVLWLSHARSHLHSELHIRHMSADSLVETRQRLLKLGAQEAVKLVPKLRLVERHCWRGSISRFPQGTFCNFGAWTCGSKNVRWTMSRANCMLIRRNWWQSRQHLKKRLLTTRTDDTRVIVSEGVWWHSQEQYLTFPWEPTQKLKSWSILDGHWYRYSQPFDF